MRGAEKEREGLGRTGRGWEIVERSGRGWKAVGGAGKEWEGEGNYR